MRKAAASPRVTIPPALSARIGELRSSARRAVPLLKAMSNSSRLVILCQLCEGERSVSDLEREVGISQSGISQHLAILRREHVVATRRDRQTVYYSLASPEVAALMGTLHQVFCKPSRQRAKSRAAA